MVATFFLPVLIPRNVMKKYLPVLLLIPFLLISGCLDVSDFDDPNTTFVLKFNLDDGVGEDYAVDGDTLIIIGAKFIIDNIELEALEENEVFAPNNVLVQISGFDLGNGFEVGGGEIFGGNYTGISYDLTLADSDTEIIDPELVVRNDQGAIIDRFSFVINGVYNKEPFLFKSRLDERINIDFEENVEMPENLGTLRATLIGDWKRWFLEDGKLLDPNVSSNKQKIEENFEKFFFAELFTIGQLN